MGQNEFLLYRGNGFEVISVKPRLTPQERFAQRRERIRSFYEDGEHGDLTDRERIIIELRYLPERPKVSARELGSLWDVSKSEVERIERKLDKKVETKREINKA